MSDLLLPEPAPRDVTPMLAALAGMGLGLPIVGMFSEFAEMKLLADDRRYLTGPFVVHRSGWEDTIPKWMFDQVAQERVEIVFGKAPWIVGPTELAAVMLPASYQAPFNHNTADLYLWATTHACARHYGKPVEEYWKQLDTRPITDAEVLERGGRLWHDYQQLAHDIRCKVVNAAASREKPEIKPSAPKHQKDTILDAVQLDLF